MSKLEQIDSTSTPGFYDVENIEHVYSQVVAPPPTPPLPPLLVSARQLDAVSNPPGSEDTEPECSSPGKPDETRPDYQPSYYFFYGILARPDILKNVLGLADEPVLRPATIEGYELATWGDYRAPITSAAESVVTGRPYLVQSAKHESRLAYFETNA